jgi:hypothetical protein
MGFLAACDALRADDADRHRGRDAVFRRGPEPRLSVHARDEIQRRGLRGVLLRRLRLCFFGACVELWQAGEALFGGVPRFWRARTTIESPPRLRLIQRL